MSRARPHRRVGAARGRGIVLVALVALLAATLPVPVGAQSWRTREIVFGGALGTYSGAAFGLLGGLIPCDRTPATLTCARSATAVGALTGLVSGVTVGNRDPDALHDRLRASGYGGLIGTAVGVGLRRFVRQYDGWDVLASAALGAAIGPSAREAGLGFVVTAVPAVVLWKGIGAIGLADAVALSLGGVALGGLVGWVLAAEEGGAASGATVTIPFSFPF